MQTVLQPVDEEAALDGAVEFFYENEAEHAAHQSADPGYRRAGLSLPLHGLASVSDRGGCSHPGEAYAQAGLSEEIFWNTFQDLKYKLLECREVQGVWGNFVSFWYPIFYTCDIFQAGQAGI